MRIQFCGADRTVTGSCHLIEVNGLRILLDCGLFQGPRALALKLNSSLPDSPSTLDAVILSHAHLDHCGKLPVLVKAGFKGPIYCTPATGEVSRVILQDAARIQLENSQFLNQRVNAPQTPPTVLLYGPDDVNPVLHLFRRVNRSTPVDLGKGVSFTFHNAGHILGSCYLTLDWSESGKPRRLLFTADVGRYDTPILPDPETLPSACDYVITESTYGNHKHAPMADVGPQLLDAVKTCIANRSRLLVPSFALGRSQTILWYVQRFIDQKLIPPIPLFIDSPMGVEISHIYSQFRDEYDTETSSSIGQRDLFGLANTTFSSTVQDSKAINNRTGPCVIIASSPTCEFGRILHHLRYSLERATDIVLFCGWTPPDTLGRRLQNGEKRVRIFDRFYNVDCQIRVLDGLSAHADGDELLRFLAPTLKPTTHAYVVHGEPDQADAFADRLLKAGVGRASVPALQSIVLES